jgi:signal transduction histidine kinase
MWMVKLAQLVLFSAALTVGGITAALIVTGGVADTPSLTATFALIIGLGWCLTGIGQWRRRPTNRIGPLMVILGFAWFASQFQETGVSVLFTIGLFAEAIYIAIFAHVLLSFPTGRLDSRLCRAIVIAAYVDTTLVAWTAVFFDSNDYGSVENLALISSNEELATTIGDVASGIGVILTVLSLVIVAERWRRATPPARRTLAPVLWSGWAAAAVGGLALLMDATGDKSDVIDFAWLAVFATVPYAFKVALLRSRIARAAVASLVVELGESRAPGGKLREALARTLRDPSLEVAYWLPEGARYVDVDGHTFDLPPENGSRVATLVEREGQRVAALVHDASLLEDPELVDAVGAAAGLALENERLQADLRSRLDELRASRARIVEATDAARKRVERDLHDGAQQRLVSVSMALGLAESKLQTDPAEAGRILAEAREGLGLALQELRELSQGIHPGILTERGLGAALQELAYRAPVPVDVSVALENRLPEHVEAAAYFVVTEALANAAKYASASSVSVRVARQNGLAVVNVEDDGVGGANADNGSGLRGLTDRVEALGGRLSVDSPPGAGTHLEAMIPCAS